MHVKPKFAGIVKTFIAPVSAEQCQPPLCSGTENCYIKPMVMTAIFWGFFCFVGGRGWGLVVSEDLIDAYASKPDIYEDLMSSIYDVKRKCSCLVVNQDMHCWSLKFNI